MSWFTKEKKTFPWEPLTSIEQLNEVLSSDEPTIIFKHSTRCSISALALEKFENNWNTSNEVKLLYLDLLNNRPTSNAIAELTGVEHQSPQLIFLNEGKVLYHQSHNGIKVNDIEEYLKNS